MKRLVATFSLALGLAMLGPIYGSIAVAQTTGMYGVEIVNLVPQQHFTPVLVVTHNADAALYTPGWPASAELQALAEGGDVGPLSAVLKESADVMDIQTADGLHGPGETTSVTIMGGGNFNRVSLAAMLIPTNDGFVAINTTLPEDGEIKEVYAYGWDAGTEMNDELCASIPGPSYPECGGPGGGGAPGGGEGRIVIHSGIRGYGDFGADRNWNNPIARIRIWQVQ